MSSGSSFVPIAKLPSDRTLTVAISLLAVVAIVQVIFAVVAFAPELGSAVVNRPAEAAPDRPVVDDAPVARAPVEGPPMEVIERANAFLDEADSARRVGDLQGALDALVQADQLVPDEPGILFQQAVVHEELGNRVEAVELLRRVSENPALRTNPMYADIREQVDMAMAVIDTTPEVALPDIPEVSAPPSAVGEGESAMLDFEPPGFAAPMRDSVGIPIGSMIGIVDCRLQDGEPGFRNLRIATKADPGERIDASQVNVMVNFFEQTDEGDIIQTTESPMAEWLSPPVDWANNEPELLQVQYQLPTDDLGEMQPIQFYGYTVGVYYQGELQDSRAEPVTLLDQYQLELSIPGAGR